MVKLFYNNFFKISLENDKKALENIKTFIKLIKEEIVY